MDFDSSFVNINSDVDGDDGQINNRNDNNTTIVSTRNNNSNDTTAITSNTINRTQKYIIRIVIREKKKTGDGEKKKINRIRGGGNREGEKIIG